MVTGNNEKCGCALELDARFGDDAIKLGVAVGAFSDFDNNIPTTYEYF